MASVAGETEDGAASDPEPRSMLRRIGIASLVWVVLLLGCGVLAWPAVSLVVGTIAALFHLARTLVALAPRRRHDLAASAARAALYSLVVAVSFVSVRGYDRVAKARAGEVVHAIDAYHAQHDHYPTRLTDLVPDPLPRVEKAMPTPLVDRPFHYRFREDGYTLWYLAAFMVARIYDSRDGQWRTRD